MSGSPKYSSTELERRRQQELAEKRRQAAEAEAQRRREAAERERQRQLNQGRNQLDQTLQTFQTNLSADQNLLYPADFQTLSQEHHALRWETSQAGDQQALKKITQKVNRLSKRLEAAKAQKRRDDAEKQRLAELDQQRFDLGELEQQRKQLDPAVVQKFDSPGSTQVQHALEAAHKAINTGKPEQVKKPLATAAQTLQKHQQTLETAQEQWQKAYNTAQEQLQELQSLLAGLKADPVVQRWEAASLTHLEALAQQASTALSQEQFNTVATVLSQVRSQGETTIATANQAQLKADQRDYITDSIAATLEAMGFTVVHRQPEHPGHPASATILGAASHAGKGISVSIPVEGEVYYDVEGYAKQTVQSVGGGNAAICDEAEQVIGEMHRILETEFGVHMGELMWEGKDPNRQLRKADDLPQSGVRQQRSQQA